MYDVERRFIRKSESSPPCEGHYEYRVTGIIPAILNIQPAQSEWLSQAEYFNWKHDIISENFPTCEAK